jgi:hypothetical protein
MHGVHKKEEEDTNPPEDWQEVNELVDITAYALLGMQLKLGTSASLPHAEEVFLYGMFEIPRSKSASPHAATL